MNDEMQTDETLATAIDRRLNYDTRIGSIYLAGKVDFHGDWREGVVAYAPVYDVMLSTDPGHAHKARYGGIVYEPDTFNGGDDNPDAGRTHWQVRRRAIFGRYDYTGPYVTDMGHGCNDFQGNSEFVVAECLAAIKRSDLVFAWIDDVTAYATLAELGYAKALGKKVWIAGPAEFEDLWFLYQMADRVNFGADEPSRALFKMLTRIATEE